MGTIFTTVVGVSAGRLPKTSPPHSVSFAKKIELNVLDAFCDRVLLCFVSMAWSQDNRQAKLRQQRKQLQQEIKQINTLLFSNTKRKNSFKRSRGPRP